MGPNFLSLVLSTFLAPILGPRQLSLVCPESRDLVRSFGPSFRVRGLFSGSRFGDRVSLPLALVPFSGCVSFPASEPGARLLGGCARAMDSLNLGTWASHSPSTLFETRSLV